MRSQDIEIGGTYRTKISGRAVDVRIQRAIPRGGWDAISLSSNKKIRIKAKQSLRAVTAEPETAESSAVESAGIAAPETPVEEVAAKAPPTDPDLVPLTQIHKEKKGGTKPKAAKPVKEPKPPKAEKAMSCLDAAAEVLKAKGEPMQCKAMIEGMFAAGLWHSDAPTPAATLYSAILREINLKKDASRFRKTDRGHFTLA